MEILTGYDAGAVGGWSTSNWTLPDPADGPDNIFIGVGGVVTTTSAISSPPLYINISLFTAGILGMPYPTAAGWYSLFTFNGLSATMNPSGGPPGCNAPVLVVTNANGNSSNCNTVVFFTNQTCALAGAQGGRRSLHAAAAAGAAFSGEGVDATISFRFDSGGAPAVPTDAAGLPYALVPYPPSSGYVTHCKAPVLPIGSQLVVGLATPLGGMFPAAFNYLSVSG